MRIPAFILCTFAAFALISCKKDPIQNNNPPDNSFSITLDTAVLQPLVSAKIAVTLHNAGSLGYNWTQGLCWSKSPDPTPKDNGVIRDNTLSSYTALIENLAPFTKYYFRGYVIAKSDTFYSEPAVITTQGLNVVFDKDYKYSSDIQIIQVDGDETNGIFILSYAQAPFTNTVHPRLTKIDASGNELWSYEYNQSEYKWPQFMRKVSDGYVIASIYNYQPGDVRTVLMKVDFNGNKVWEKEFKKDAFQNFLNLDQVSGQLSLTINSYHLNESNDFTSVSLWRLILDGNGNTVSETAAPDYSLPNGPVLGFNSLPAADKGFFAFRNDVRGPVYIRLFRFSSTNQPLWDRVYDDAPGRYASSGFLAPNGNYVISSYGEFVNNDAMQPGWIFEVDQNTGQYVWQYHYQANAAENGKTVPMAITYQDAFYVTGDFSPAFAGYTSRFILKLDNNGKFLWDVPLAPKEPAIPSRASAIYVSPSHNIYIVGIRVVNPSENAYMYVTKYKE